MRKTQAIQIKLEIMYSQSSFIPTFTSTAYILVFVFKDDDTKHRARKRRERAWGKKGGTRKTLFRSPYAEKNKLQTKKSFHALSPIVWVGTEQKKQSWWRHVGEIKEMFPFFRFISPVVTIWLNDNVHWVYGVIKIESFPIRLLLLLFNTLRHCNCFCSHDGWDNPFSPPIQVVKFESEEKKSVLRRRETFPSTFDLQDDKVTRRKLRAKKRCPC